MAQALVDDPDAVEVEEIQGEHNCLLELKVAKEDIGKVIGRGGKIAKSIRNVVRAAAAKENKRVIVDIN